MPALQTNQPLLRCARTDIDGTGPFDNDLLERRDLALKLTGYLDRLNEGAVLALDAPWGEGKTWFGKNWEQYLKASDRKVVYIDAFEQDYIEDPFVLLASEFFELINEGDEALEVFKDKATKVAKATMSIGAKIGMSLFAKYALGGVDIGEEIEKSIGDASDEVSALTSKWIEAKFDEYKQDKETIDAFRKDLKAFAEAQDKPMVIFIDELDRCKPDFAVKLIERIKHFFDVPNIVFILLINREQIESAIKGVYGTDTDASAYLGKFVNFFFRLPKPTFEDYGAEGHIGRYVIETFGRYRFPDNIDSIIRLTTTLSVAFNLSLRDIEKVAALYAFAYPVPTLEEVLIYVIVLKQKDFAQFRKLLKGDKKAHEKMKNKLDHIIEIEERRSSSRHMFLVFKEWHDAYLNDFDSEKISEKIQHLHGLLQRDEYDITPREMLPYFAKKIDLVIER